MIDSPSKKPNSQEILTQYKQAIDELNATSPDFTQIVSSINKCMQLLEEPTNARLLINFFYENSTITEEALAGLNNLLTALNSEITKAEQLIAGNPTFSAYAKQIAAIRKMYNALAQFQ